MRDDNLSAVLKIMFLPWLPDPYFGAGVRWLVFGCVLLIVLSNSLGIYFTVTR